MLSASVPLHEVFSSRLLPDRSRHDRDYRKSRLTIWSLQTFAHVLADAATLDISDATNPSPVPFAWISRAGASLKW